MKNVVLGTIGAIIGFGGVAFYEVRAYLDKQQQAATAQDTSSASAAQGTQATQAPTQAPPQPSAAQRTPDSQSPPRQSSASAHDGRPSTGPVSGAPPTRHASPALVGADPPTSRQRPDPTRRSFSSEQVTVTPPDNPTTDDALAAPPTARPTSPTGRAQQAGAQRPTPSPSPAVPAGNVSVVVHRVLVGAQLAQAALLDSATLDDHGRHGRYVVYLDIAASSRDGQSPQISFKDFRLEDTKGLLYEPIAPKDALGARVAQGGTARGGVAFAVYNDAAPARLQIRTANGRFRPLPETIFSPGP